MEQQFFRGFGPIKQHFHAASPSPFSQPMICSNSEPLGTTPARSTVHHVVTIVVHPLSCRLERYFRLFMRHTAEAATIPYVGIPKRTP
jgi:hypothetical protein